MSRGAANLLYGLVSGLTFPMSRRQRLRTFARLRDRIQSDGLIRVATRRGDLVFDAGASAYSASAADRFHEDEPETLEWIDGFAAGTTFWDIGASMGVYSLYAALDKSINVLAFEPSGFNFGLMLEHLALNELGDNVQPFCVAMGVVAGLDKLYMQHSAAGVGGNALGAPTNHAREFAPAFAQAIMADTIDGFRARYALTAPAYIKIDVDGIEPDIVRGAADTLREVESVLIEIEHENVDRMESLISAPLRDAGLVEVPIGGSGRNRLFKRA